MKECEEASWSSVEVVMRSDEPDQVSGCRERKPLDRLKVSFPPKTHSKCKWKTHNEVDVC